MIKEWDHIIKKEEMDGIIKEIVTKYRAAFVKLVVINRKQKMIAFFKNEDTLLKVIGKSVTKDFLDQWTMRIQDDRFTTNVVKKDKKEKSRKKNKKETIQNGKRKEKSKDTTENEKRDTQSNDEVMDCSSSDKEVSSLMQQTRSSKTNDFDYKLANEVQTSFASRLKSVNAEKGPLK
ncbi:hypothetical protein RclHR1_01100004 [Rhizophagus clarus]|uniref:Uncharacterized protein n=1 Tax=Rhizophagus clarus TaxID=94130 RepID=A0A2Z6Q7R2_9GLOM|nr:hypothetical protein RclHR1_01100004 [Rhizophagus clarus]